MFDHHANELLMVVHDDDVTVSGCAKDLDWFRQGLPNQFEVKLRRRLAQ